ncbi:acyltransferase family protein [Chitinilyticum piscinae]|uniref:Acyltransferase n=1 Tax=Chitinilyticum piscinae TaxID=2866724 RepID=A0A8J7FQY6_9NEIS|nr:acyltransferase [Chitinilyticum piscinae]MBE9609141.1 acyltransferase [Chitinilyticum piscinae]
MKSRYFHALDGLRGIAMLLVISYHITYGWPGYLAVEFFMLLSGFVLAHTVLDKPQRPDGLGFVLHRLWRLYPLHLLALLAFAGAATLNQGRLPQFADGTLFTFVQQLTLTHNIGFNPGGLTWNFPAWCVSVEFWLNVLVFFVLPARLRTAQILLLALAGYLLLFNTSHMLGVHHQLYWGWLASGMVRGFASFMLGWFVYRACAHPRTAGALRRWQGELLEWLPLLGLLPIFLLKIENSPLDFVAALLMAVLLGGVALARGSLSRLLALPPLQYLGRISYASYLLHIPVLELFYKMQWHAVTLGLPLFWLLFVGACLAAGSLAHHYVEMPLRRRVARRPAPELAAAAAVA